LIFFEKRKTVIDMNDIFPLLNSQGKILYVLGSGPKTSRELIQLTRLSPSTLYYNLKDLIVHGLVIKLKDGKYAITDKGLRTLNRLVKALSQTIPTSP